MEVGKFYDRWNGIVNWYYQCYSIDQAQNVDDYGFKKTQDNLLVSAWLGLTSGWGSIAIVKNGPADAGWNADLRMQLDSLVRSIWWYMRSGNDCMQVFGERKLSRFIMGL